MTDFSHEYCQAKILILKDYVTKCEEIFSSIENWEVLEEILTERDILIERLQNQEIEFKKNYGEIRYSDQDKKEIDSLIKLILDLDQSCIKLIQEEKNKTMQDLKINQNNQRVADYEISMTPSYGTFLDAKK